MDSENQKDYEKKKRNKTKEDIQREALTMDNFYALLGLDDKEFIATDYDIGKAYKQAALHFHPDKIGASLTEDDK
jgi:DnaJ-class molecular chaperone